MTWELINDDRFWFWGEISLFKYMWLFLLLFVVFLFNRAHKSFLKMLAPIWLTLTVKFNRCYMHKNWLKIVFFSWKPAVLHFFILCLYMGFWMVHEVACCRDPPTSLCSGLITVRFSATNLQLHAVYTAADT